MIAADKRKAVFLLHQDGMPVREMARRLKLSRNTVRTIIAQAGAMPQGVRADKQQVEGELLRRLYQACDGWVARMRRRAGLLADVRHGRDDRVHRCGLRMRGQVRHRQPDRRFLFDAVKCIVERDLFHRRGGGR